MPHRTVARRRPSLFPASTRCRPVAIVLALALASVIGIHPSDAAIAAPGTGIVSGTVIGSDGTPAVGIRVTLEPDYGPSRSADTDEHGNYQIVSYAGEHTAYFHCPTSCIGNYLPEHWDDQLHSKTPFSLAEGGSVHLETELELAGEISGIVRGDDGKPVERVTVYIESDTAEVTPPQDFAQTDSDGRYRFRNLPEAGYTLRFVPQTAFAHEYFEEFWEDEAVAATADVIQVPAGGAVGGIDPSLTPAAWISGRVVNEDGIPLGWDSDVNVFLYRVTDAGTTSWVDTGSLGKYPVGPGEFRFDGLTAGTYVLRTRSLGYGLAEWWDDQPDLASATRIVLEAGDRFEGTIVLEGGPVSLTGPTLSGTARVGETLIAAASSPTPSVSLAYQWFADELPIDGANGPTYTITPTELGSSTAIQVTATAPGRTTVTRSSTASSVVQPAVLTSATPKILGTRPALVGSTVTVDPGVWTDGTVLDFEWRADGVPIEGADDVSLTLSPSEVDTRITVAVTGSKPGYASVTEVSGWLAVSFGPVDLTTPVILGTPEVGSTLTASASSTTPGVNLSYRWHREGSMIVLGQEQTLALTDEHAGGAIAVDVLASAPGHLDVQKSSTATATVRHPSWGEITRIAGADRYDTSALISKSQFQPGVPVAYIASGANFPDALAGAPVAGVTGGPMLLTAPDWLPDSIRTELERLQPERIVILGGTSTIGTAVEARLDELWPGIVTRIAGADRFDTSALISKSQFQPGVPVAYIASGANFPDALAGAPVAGVTGGPMLLTAPDWLPDSIRTELERLQPERIVILGGTSTIGTAVEARLRELRPGAVMRIAGADRYDTSALISKSQFQPGVPVVYIASGANFPDALAGAPVAGISGGPMLLASQYIVFDSVLEEARRLEPERIVILGGTSTLYDSIDIALDFAN